MEIEYIKSYHIKRLWINIILVSITLCSCSMNKEGTEQGTVLTEFRIANEPLDSIADVFLQRIKKNDRVLLLSFEEVNDSINFVFTTCRSMHEVRIEYLFLQNYRIIGYVNKNDFDIILMTNINFLRITENIKQMIRPLDNSRLFTGLYYAPITKSNWDDGWIHDGKIRWHFKYIDNKIQGPFCQAD